MVQCNCMQQSDDDTADKDVCLLRPLTAPSSSFLLGDGMQPRGGVKMRWVILVGHSEPMRNTGLLQQMMVRKCELSLRVNLKRINRHAIFFIRSFEVTMLYN